MTYRVPLLVWFLLLTLFALPQSAYAVNRNPVWDMDGYWWLDDDASGLNVEDNTGHGAGDTAQETNITGVAKDTIVRFRVDISETNNQNTSTNLTPRLEFQAGDLACNASGTWTTITTSTTNAWALADSTTITDGDIISVDRITGNIKAFGTGTGSFHDTTNPAPAITFANKSNEWEFSIKATSAASDSQIYTFRITNNGTVLNAYNLPVANDCPTATTAAAASTSFTLNDYRWYVDSDSENVTDPWGVPDIAENTALTPLPAGNDPPGPTQELRLRVNFTVNNANLSASSQQFKLQFKAGTDGSCTSGTWTDIGAVASSAWQFASSGVTDGTTLTVLKLAASDVLEVYAKANPTATNPNSATTGQDIEYDFHIIGSGSDFANATQYSFRALESDDTVFDAYNTCPTLTTEPGTGDFMRHGNFFSGGVEQGFFWAN